MESNPILLRPVRTLMSNQWSNGVYTVKENDGFYTVSEKLISPQNVERSAAVIDNQGKVAGLIRVIDVVKYCLDLFEEYSKRGEQLGKSEIEKIKAHDIAEHRQTYSRPGYPCVSIEATVGDALEEMKRDKDLKMGEDKGVVVVGSEGEYVGFCNRHHVFKAITDHSSSIISDSEPSIFKYFSRLKKRLFNYFNK